MNSAEQHKHVDKCKATSEWTFGQDGSNKCHLDITPKFANLKEEVLNNSFARISKEKWNDILSKVHSIMNFKMGCKQRIRFSHVLKANHIKTRHILALKLYTDDDNLQSELRKCFFPNTQSAEEYKQRMSEFYHFKRELHRAFRALSKIKWNQQPSSTMLYHGIKCKSILAQRNGVFDGPLSCTTDINVARDFAGRYGMILAIKPLETDSLYQMLDISLISDFPQEKEVLLLNHNISIERIVICEDFDNNYSYFKQQYICPARSHKRRGSLSEQDLVENLQQIDSQPDDHQVKLIEISGVEAQQTQQTLNKEQETLLITQMCLLSSIYEYCQQFIYNVTKFTQKGIYDSNEQQKMYEQLKKFKTFAIQKELYEQFLDHQQIKEEDCNRVFSEYIRVAA